MHELDAAGVEVGPGFAAADHVHDFELEPLGFVEPGVVRHPDRKEGVGRGGLADLERGELGGTGRDAAQSSGTAAAAAPRAR